MTPMIELSREPLLVAAYSAGWTCSQCLDQYVLISTKEVICLGCKMKDAGTAKVVIGRWVLERLPKALVATPLGR